MQIITGLHYTYKLEQMVKECYLQAKEHPFESYVFICENTSVVEQLFFKYTHCLVNIELMSWSQFLHQMVIDNHLSKHHLITHTQYVYHLRNILKQDDLQCFHTTLIYPLIEKLIPLIKDFDLYDIQFMDAKTLPLKFHDFIKIYQCLLSKLDDDTHISYESLLLSHDFHTQYQHFYIEGDMLFAYKRQAILNKLPEDTKVLCSYDKSTSLRHDYMIHSDNSQLVTQDDFFIDNLFQQNYHICEQDLPVYHFKSSTLQQEVKKVLCTIYQHVVDDHLRYEDFMIVYPDSTYLPILIEVLTQLQLPHCLPISTSCLYDKEYRYICEDCQNTFEAPLQEIIQRYQKEDFASEYKDYFEELKDYKTVMNNQEFLEFFQATYTKNHAQQNDYQDYIHIVPIEKLRTAKPKHIFILGMNENVLPHSFKDIELLLNEDLRYLQPGHAPLNTYQQQDYHQCTIMKALLQPYLTLTLSCSQQTLSGTLLLESLLFQQLTEMLKSKVLPDPQFMCIDDFYQKKGMLENYEVNELIKDFQTNGNQVHALSPDIVHGLYSHKLSVSQLETYNKCPFMYFVQYGLKVFDKQSDELLPNEIGSLVHHILYSCLDQDLNIEDIVKNYILNNDTLKQKTMSSPINQYFIKQLIKDVQTTLNVVRSFQQTSFFKTYGKEYAIKDTIHNMNFTGFVDRIDVCYDYVSIIDYKSSDKSIDINLAMQGFNIQMLLYLKMVTDLLHKKPGAVLYFNTKKRVLASQDELVAPLNTKEFYKMYKYKGLVIDDESHLAIQSLDPTMDGHSQIIPAQYVKKSNSYKGDVLSEPELTILFDQIVEHISNLYQQMCEGCIAIAPKGSEKKDIHTKVNPCSFCAYHSICDYDHFYNDFTPVQQLDFQTLLKGEQDNGI